MGPQVNVVGSFFPSWMLCASIGVLVALFGRRLLIRIGIDPHIQRRAFVYPSLALLVTLVLWVAFFRI